MRTPHWTHFFTTRGPVQLSWAAFLSPISIGAVGVMGINDAWLRTTYPGFITGKISDVAVLLFFPLFLAALINGARAALSFITASPCRAELTPRQLTLTVGFTALVFTLLQISPDFVAFYLQFLEATNLFPWFESFRYTPDLTDLATLPTLLVTYWYGCHRTHTFPLEDPV